MTDILNQIDAVLADVTACQCGCGTPLSPRGPSPWFVDENHQARWDRRQARAKSGIEEESDEAEVFPDPLGAPVATGDSSPEGRRQFVADVAAFHASMRMPITEDLGPVRRPTFTLADMEEASAAVRARRDAPPVDAALEPNPDNPNQLRYWVSTERVQELWDELGMDEPVVEINPDPLLHAHEVGGPYKDCPDCVQPAAPAPWWRRMLGGGTR